MANVAHSTLTGSDLHEPKGVAAATAGKVYVSDGAGSGAWTAHATFAGVFGGQLFQLRDIQAASDGGQTLTSGSWNTTRLNQATVNQITSATGPTSNQISLPAGTYWLMGWSRVYMSSTGAISTLRLQNVTAGSTLVLGGSVYNGSGSGGVTLALDQTAHIQGKFTLGSTATVELQKHVNVGASGGNANGVTTNVYTDLCLWKLS